MNTVQQLQTMLNHLSRADGSVPAVEPSGVFDEQTLEAVMLYQRDHSLPVTGSVDSRTWDHLVRSCEECSSPEQDPSILKIAQEMMLAISKYTDNFTEEEIRSSPRQCISTVQQLCKLRPSGEMDRITWKKLFCLFETIVIRGAYRGISTCKICNHSV